MPTLVMKPPGDKLGEIKKAYELGLRGHDSFIWVACELCGKERWVALKHGKPESSRCLNCANSIRLLGRTGNKNNNWKGGQHLSADGYIEVYMPQHPYAQKHGGYVTRARLILEEKLGRYLLEGYEPHHINAIRDDDRPENLVEILHSEHLSLHNKLRKWNKTFGNNNG